MNQANGDATSLGMNTREPSEEGEEREEARKGIMSEKEVNTPYLSGEGIPEEEDKLNTPVTVPHTIPSYS